MREASVLSVSELMAKWRWRVCDSGWRVVERGTAGPRRE